MASVWCEMVGTVGTLVQALSIRRRPTQYIEY